MNHLWKNVTNAAQIIFWHFLVPVIAANFVFILLEEAQWV